MFRLYDFECLECGNIQEILVDTPRGESPSKITQGDCETCEATTSFERRLSLPAPYMGERVLNPVMHGGRFDTAGMRDLPDLPDLPGETERQAKVAAKIDAMGVDKMPARERSRAIVGASSDAPSSNDYRSLFESREYKRAKRDRELINSENAEKRKRHAAIKRGENINMRRDRCKGDPKITA